MNADTSATRYRRSFPKGWVPFVASIFGLWCVCAFSSSSIQIAPYAENGSGAIGAALCALLIGGVLGIIAARNDTAMLMRSIIAFGAAAALGAAMIYGPASATIRGMIDFPSATTREYRAFIPILAAGHHESGRSHASWVRLLPYHISVNIVSQDYRFMQRALGNSGNAIPSNGYFCADVLAQQAGDAVRILHTTLGTLPPNSVIVCPHPIANR